MSVHPYLDKKIIEKNRRTYFGRGKWIFHILIILCYFLAFAIDGIKELKQGTVKQYIIVTLVILPFVSFYFFYCLYLIPYCFKLNKYRKFWSYLIPALIILPLCFYCIELLAKPYLPELAKELNKNATLKNIAEAYGTFLYSFIGFTAMLYFMELLENIRTLRETENNKTELLLTELHQIKMQIDPNFMIQSLDGIIKLTEEKDEHAANAVIDFSDVLRHRLYRSKEKLVSLKNELDSLRRLFDLQNSINKTLQPCTLEIEGNTEDATIIPLSLLNLAEPLIIANQDQSDWSLLMYLLVEEEEIQVAIEINTTAMPRTAVELKNIEQNLKKLLHANINFTIEHLNNNYSLRTCIPIYKNSIAL